MRFNEQARIDSGFSESAMYANKESDRIHPLMAGATVSVLLVSRVGAAAITGILSTSH